MKKHASVDAYLASLPAEQATVLSHLRAIIKTVAPAAEERISYGMPGYYLHGPLVYFAAFKKHCSLFVGGTSFLKGYEKELKDFHTAGSTIHFTPEFPLPDALVKKMIKHRVRMNEEKRVANRKS